MTIMFRIKPCTTHFRERERTYKISVFTSQISLNYELFIYNILQQAVKHNITSVSER